MATRGQKRHLVKLYNPGTMVPDGEGGYTQARALIGIRMADIRPATVRDLERITSGTVQSTASHIVTFDYLAEVTTKTEIDFGTRVFTVNGVSNPEERNIETIAVCSEVVA